jgi:hypothetical protein
MPTAAPVLCAHIPVVVCMRLAVALGIGCNVRLPVSHVIPNVHTDPCQAGSGVAAIAGSACPT